MSKINNKNLISLGLGLLIIFAFTISLIPKDARADFEQRCEILNFNASQNYVTLGGSSTLNWNTNNCNSVSISTIGDVNMGGSQVVYPTKTITYVLTAIGLNGATLYQSKTVTVKQPSCEILNFNVSQNYVTSGGSSVLDWNTNNCNSVSISNIGNVNTGGYQIVYPKQTTTYVLTATNSDRTSISQSRTITVAFSSATSSTSNSIDSTGNTSNTSGTNNSNTSTTNTTNATGTTNQSDNGNNVGNLAAGAIFGYNAFLPSSIFQWLFLAILILLAVVLWRKLYVSESDKETPLKHA